MSNDASPNRWFNAWRSPARPVLPDPADLGTAFGLDASFEDSQATSPQPLAATPKPNWMQRLSARARRHD